MSPNHKQILVVGAAHMDIICKINKFHPGKDIPGEIFYGFGGTGLNISIGIGSHNIETRFLTSMGDGGVNRMIARSIEEVGIDIWPYWCDIGQSGFCVMIEDGDMRNAVSATPMENVAIPSDLARRSLENIDFLVIDANSGIENIRLLTTMAKEMHIPVCVAGVSPAKVTRVPDSGIWPNMLFLNREEMETLLSHTGFNDVSELSLITGTSFVVTDGPHGIDVFEHRGMKRIRKTHFDAVLKFDQTSDGSLIGLGDALLSGSVARIVSRGISIRDAVRESQWELPAIMDKVEANTGIGTLDTVFKKIHADASTDTLTGLHNRMSGMDILSKMMEKSKKTKEPISLIFIDLDAFKQINDTLGHNEGDKVLVESAKCLESHIRKGRDYVIRLGGDEFLVILSNCTDEMAHNLIGRIQQDDWKSIGRNVEGFGLSIGIKKWDFISDVQDLISEADEEMYREKMLKKEVFGGEMR